MNPESEKGPDEGAHEKIETATSVEPAAGLVNTIGRGKPSSEGRFIWLSCLAVERIVNELGQNQAAYGMAVYVALCRLSSKEKNNPQVRATIQKIAGMARLGYRKTFDTLHALETTAKVISIEAGKRTQGEATQPPSTYTLLACRLHNRKSDRLHDRKSADCMRRTLSRAEIPKELPVRVVDKETVLAPAGLPRNAATPAAGTVSDRMTWDGEAEL